MQFISIIYIHVSGDQMEIYFILGFLFFTLATITLISGIYLYRIKLSTGTRELALLCFAVTLYCIGYALEIASKDLSLKIVFNTIKFIPVFFLAPLWLFFVLKLLKRKCNKKWCKFLVLIVPIVSLILRLTNEIHGLYYTNAHVNLISPFKELEYTPGPWVYVFAGLNVIVITIIFIFIIIDIIKEKDNRQYAIIMLASFLVLLFSASLAMLSKSKNFIMLLPLILPILVTFISLQIYRFNFFNIIPLSHSKVFEWSENGIMVLDNQLRLTDFNKAMQDIFPQIAKNDYGTKLEILIEESSRLENAIVQSKECTIKIENTSSVSHYNINSTVLYDKKHRKSGFMVTFTNVTKLIDTMDELSYLANTDSLTGLYTRRMFTERAKKELIKAKIHGMPLSFVMLDIDQFKKINDTLGHVAGDNVLKDIAKVCKNSLRSVDLLGRFGGEEFIILLPETDTYEAVLISERIRKRIEELTIIFEGKSIKVNVSLGVAGVKKVTSEDLDMFIINADKAMYSAKMSGRNKVILFNDL